ncbi:MAG: ATP-binding protein [Opitutales bacterium]
MSGPPEPRATGDHTLNRLLADADAAFPGDAGRTLELTDAGLARAEPEADPLTCGKLLQLRANALMHLGRTDEVARFIEEHQPFLERHNLLRQQLGFLNIRAMMASRKAQYREALRWQNQALQRARELDDPAVTANLTSNAGLDLIYLGEFSAALELLEESLTLWRQAEDQRSRVPTLINAGLACDRLKRPGAALAYYEEALDVLKERPDPRFRVTVLLNYSGALRKAGRRQEGRFFAEEAVKLGRQHHLGLRLAHALQNWARVEQDAGAETAARESLEEALAIYRQIGNDRGIATTLITLAELAPTGDEQAEPWCREGLTVAERAELKPEQARAWVRLAELLKKRGDAGPAYEALSRGRELEQAVYDDEAHRRVQALEVHKEVAGMRRELEAERSRSTRMEELLRELDELRERAEEESRQKSALLGYAAHDLRSLSGNLVTLLELVEAETDLTTRKGLLRDARVSSKNLWSLLERLMDVSAVQRGVVSFHPKTFRLREGLDTILNRWKAVAAAKGQTFEVALPDTEVVVDLTRLGQILNNLLSNGVKYTPVGGRIGLCAESRSDTVFFEVWDTGPGIPPEDRDRLFLPFQPLSNRPTGGEESVGLGLHLIRSLARLQGGDIRWEPRSGGGSRFLVELPVRPDA